MYCFPSILSSLFIVSFSSLNIFKTLYFKSLSSSLMTKLPQVWFLLINFFPMNELYFTDSLYA